MSRQKKIAIVAALDREVHPLVKNWESTSLQHDGHEFSFYESNYAVAVISGVGEESARRAAEAVVANCSPRMLISAGIAGALVSDLHVGDTIFPAIVVDARDSSRHETGIEDAPLGNSPLARTVLVTYPEIGSAAQKQQLAKAYGAHAVDMEAVAVARAAEKHGLTFIAIKAISDEQAFDMPEMNRFIRNGRFQTTQFVLYVTFRPWLWLKVTRLAYNTKLAAENLCAWLRESALINTIVPGMQNRTGEMSVPNNRN